MPFGVFLQGKFDRPKQSQPYSAVASAFDNYFDWLLRDENATIAAKVSTALRKVLGRGVYAISRLIPNLLKIVGDDDGL